MKELDFNLENAVKVVKAMERGLVIERAKDVLASKIKGESTSDLLAGMLQVATLFVDILTNETDFRDALTFLSKQGVTIE